MMRVRDKIAAVNALASEALPLFAWSEIADIQLTHQQRQIETLHTEREYQDSILAAALQQGDDLLAEQDAKIAALEEENARLKKEQARQRADARNLQAAQEETIRGLVTEAAAEKSQRGAAEEKVSELAGQAAARQQAMERLAAGLSALGDPAHPETGQWLEGVAATLKAANGGREERPVAPLKILETAAQRVHQERLSLVETWIATTKADATKLPGPVGAVVWATANAAKAALHGYIWSLSPAANQNADPRAKTSDGQDYDGFWDIPDALAGASARIDAGDDFFSITNLPGDDEAAIARATTAIAAQANQKEYWYWRTQQVREQGVTKESLYHQEMNRRCDLEQALATANWKIEAVAEAIVASLEAGDPAATLTARSKVKADGPVARLEAAVLRLRQEFKEAGKTIADLRRQLAHEQEYRAHLRAGIGLLESGDIWNRRDEDEIVFKEGAATRAIVTAIANHAEAWADLSRLAAVSGTWRREKQRLLALVEKAEKRASAVVSRVSEGFAQNLKRVVLDWWGQRKKKPSPVAGRPAAPKPSETSRKAPIPSPSTGPAQEPILKSRISPMPRAGLNDDGGHAEGREAQTSKPPLTGAERAALAKILREGEHGK